MIAALQNQIDALPKALRLLLDIRGVSSLRHAARLVQENTGFPIGSSMLSKYTRGESEPVPRTLLAILVGLGFDLHDLATAIEFVLEQERSARALRKRARTDPRFRQYLLTTLRKIRNPSEDLVEWLHFLEKLAEDAA